MSDNINRWTTVDTEFNTHDDTPPSIVVFQGWFHGFFIDQSSNRILHIISPDGVSWSSSSRYDTGLTSSASPCAVVYQNNLLLFSRDPTGNRLYNSGSSDGINFGGWRNDVGLDIDRQPSVDILDNRICILAIDAGGNGIMRATYDGSSWSHGYIGYGTHRHTRPCVVAFQNKFHCFFVDWQGNGLLHVVSSDGVNWSPQPSPKDWFIVLCSSQGPSVVSHNNMLHLFFRDHEGDGILTGFSPDGINFYKTEPEWYTGQSCDWDPAAAVLNGQACILSIKHGGNGILCAFRDLNLPQPSNLDLLNLAIVYAPRVWLAKGEKYFPSSVEFTFENTVRYLEHDQGDRYCLKTKEELASPSDVLHYFYGDTVRPIYAFCVDKKTVLDVGYFTYYPYNRGKEIADTMWGNHVGDWEHITLRFLKNSSDGRVSYQPFQVFLSAHDGGMLCEWQALRKIDGTHPVVCAAWGSHGLYMNPREFEYRNYGVAKLVDECSEGTAWDTWTNVKVFDYNNKKDLAGNPWPTWLSEDYGSPGPNPSDPRSGAIYRWGNHKQGFEVSGESRLNDGAGGPLLKDQLFNFDAAHFG